LVINFEIARSGDDYVHRIGRTGRAGRQGLAITLIGSLEWNPMSSIERYLNTRFERRAIKELPGTYKGPKKLKSSGKAAGSKKRKLEKKAAATRTKPKRTAAKKAKGRAEDRSRSSHRNADQTPARDGFAPLKRAKPPANDA